MNIKEYQQLALRTEARNPEHTQADRWIHGVLGFVTEHQEFFAARDSVETVEEFGDLMWYVVLLADVAHVDLAEVMESIETPNDLHDALTLTFETWLARCADTGKRWKYYNIPPSESALKETVTQLFLYARTFWFMRGSYGSDTSEALDRNIAKLKARYPEKFTTEAAANRDLAAERVALEGGDK